MNNRRMVLFTSFVLHAMNVARGAAHTLPPMSFDILLKNGMIFDGTGSPGRRADVGISNNHIAAIGDLASAHSPIELDVHGLYVAPGFINIHSHPIADALPSSENMLTQGVTTEIANPDGEGPTNIGSELEAMERAGLAVNIGAYIGFNSVWASVVGPSDHRATNANIQQMRELIVSNLRIGAWGISAGLDYKPAYYATAEEVIAVASAGAPWRTNFPNHERLTPETDFSSTTGIAETLRIATDAGLTPVVTHIKAQGHEQGRAVEILAMMQSVAKQAPAVSADVYPYLAGHTDLDSLLVPGWAQDGGRKRMLERFKDPSLRGRISHDIEVAMTARFNGPQGVYLPDEGRELVDIMSERHIDAGEAVIEILEKKAASVILRFGAESDLIEFLQNPSTAIACDCGSSQALRVHPRFYGTFPRVLGHYVRELKTLTWEDAIRKMTGLPASIIGLTDRGFLQPGMAADVTVFNPKSVIDHATYDAPKRLSAGIRYVLVNGKLALREGKVTGEKGGLALRRTEHMPTRALRLSRQTRVSAHGTVASMTHPNQTMHVSLEISQAHGRARGTFQFFGVESRLSTSGPDLGLLQSAPGWASFTATARVSPTGAWQPILVTLDEADPLSACKEVAITVAVNDNPKLDGCIARAVVHLALGLHALE